MRLFDVPEPSQWISHDKVEEVATIVNNFYREKTQHTCGYPVNIIDFADLHLEISIVWEETEEPSFTNVFAKCSLSNEQYKIIINERHRELFEARSDILRSCIAHEIGHCILLHHIYGQCSGETPTLFTDIKPQPQFLHDSSWFQYGVSRKELEQLLVKTAAVDKEAREILEQLQDRLELDWMFRQAEHFSMCFLIPGDKLFEHLNDGWDVCSWPSLYRLSERFGVSISMLCVRLRKLGMIEIWKDKRITPGPALLQSVLFYRPEPQVVN